MALRASTLRTEKELHSYLLGVTDAHTRAITEAWVVAWDTTVRELEHAAIDLAAARRGGVVTGTHLNNHAQIRAALPKMEAALEYAIQRTGQIITADVHAVMEYAGAAELEMIETQLGGGRRAVLRASLVRADPAQIGEMVVRATQQITSLLLPMSERAYSAVKAELLRGMVVGENPRAAARRMVSRVGDIHDLQLSRALTIARTEMLDAARAATYAVDQANAHLLAGWLWIAHLDSSTCMSCVAQHGTLHPIDEPGPYDHQNGRCARVPKTKTWQELGFSGMEDPPDHYPDADAWFAGLSEEQQRRTLGKAGYEAYKDGRFPRRAWSVRRSNDGWRDSYVPRRPPRAGVSYA